jgi:hypothetical protein
MSHAQSDGVTHTRVTPLILGTEIFDGTDRIDMTADVHVKVNCIKECNVTMLKNRVMYTDAIEKCHI